MLDNTSDQKGLGELLDRLRQAGQIPDRALLDEVKAFGQAAVGPLIQVALDEQLNHAGSDSTEVWTPIHAIQLLGELGAVEAIEPLLSLFTETDDDYLDQMLPKAFAGIGPAALEPLRAYLFDREHDIWSRARAAECLASIGQAHPAARSEAVGALVARLDPAEAQTPDDEMLNSFIISDLLRIDAVEAEPAIRRAFAEDHVDTSIINLDDVDRKLDPLSGEIELDKIGSGGVERPARGMRLRLRCTACGYEREHQVEKIYYDQTAADRREKGEPAPYSEFVIPQRIVCPKCGAVDQYELAPLAYAALIAEVLRTTMAARGISVPGIDLSGESALQFISFELSDGRKMHPYAAREMYRQEVETRPDDAGLRIRYGNVLRFLGRDDEAAEEFRAAVRLEPASLEAYLNLARLAESTGDLAEARRQYESLLIHAPQSKLPRKTRDEYVRAAREELAELSALAELSILPSGEIEERARLARAQERLSHMHVATSSASPSATPSARAIPKVGRNDPCPCGSGKKYKKCHGR